MDVNQLVDLMTRQLELIRSERSGSDAAFVASLALCELSRRLCSDIEMLSSHAARQRQQETLAVITSMFAQTFSGGASGTAVNSLD
jgi:hypothetical protein